jgi:uncharacterized protein YqgV (UPF0045/DUF77 family)
MRTSAQISVYPLRQQHLGPAIEAVCLAFENEALAPEVGPMSTLASGDAERIFAALRVAFESAASTGDGAMVITLANACPADVRDARVVGDLRASGGPLSRRPEAPCGGGAGSGARTLAMRATIDHVSPDAIHLT